MRQQYHSKTINGQRCVWDVYGLIEKAKSLPVIDIPLSQISELDEAYWYDDPNGKQPITRDIALHAMLINQCDLKYPIILDIDGKVMDGMHRCCKALIEGREHIQAVQFDERPAPDYIDPEPGSLTYSDDFDDVLKKFGLSDGS